MGEKNNSMEEEKIQSKKTNINSMNEKKKKEKKMSLALLRSEEKCKSLFIIITLGNETVQVRKGLLLSITHLHMNKNNVRNM